VTEINHAQQHHMERIPAEAVVLHRVATSSILYVKGSEPAASTSSITTPAARFRCDGATVEEELDLLRSEVVSGGVHDVLHYEFILPFAGSGCTGSSGVLHIFQQHGRLRG
jgi:hypothetical protein